MSTAGLTGTDPSVVLGFRVRDAATPELQNIERQMESTERQTQEMGQSFSVSAALLATLGSAIVTASGQMAQLAVQFGIIPEEMERTVQTGIQMLGVLASLAGVIEQLNRVQRINIILTSISRALMSPIGIATVLAALGVGAIAAAAVSRFSQTAPGQFQVVPGTSTETSLARVHGGEVIGRMPGPAGRTPGDGGGGLTVNVQAGAFVGSESDADKFARMVGRRLQGLDRRTGFRV